MSVWRAVLVLIVSASFAITAWSHDEPVEEDTGPWSGNVGLGFLKSTGNTEDTSVLFNFLVGYETGAWNHALDGRIYSVQTTDQDNGVDNTTAAAYQLGWKSTIDINDSNYVFGALDWIKDRKASYVKQTFETVGYGRRVIQNDTHTLNIDVGAGFSQQELAPFCSTTVSGIPGADNTCPADPVQELVVGQNEDGIVGVLGGDYRWNVNKDVTFSQDLDVFIASDNTYWESVTALRANLVGGLALVASYTIKANTDIPSGKKKRDTYTAISLDYLF
jgi:putative salt-induced outer membrane protein